MGSSDLEFLIGGSNAQFIKVLKETEGLAGKSAARIARSFQKMERERVAALRDTEKEAKAALRRESAARKKMQIQMNKAATIGFAALAGAAALAGKAIGKAAERDDDMARSLLKISEAKDNFLADIGDDFKPFLDGIAEGIDRLGEMRKVLVAIRSIGFGGNPFEVMAVYEEQERARRLKKEFKQKINFQNLERELVIAGGGPGAQDAKDLNAERAFKKKVADTDLTKRDQEKALVGFKDIQLAQADDRKKAEAQKKLAASLDGVQRALNADAALKTARSEQSPFDSKAFVAASVAREDAQKQRVTAEIGTRKGGSLKGKLVETLKANAVIAIGAQLERDAHAELMSERMVEDEFATRALAMERASGEIAILRANGFDDQAKAAQINLDHSRSQLAIDRMILKDEEQRTGLHEQQNRLLTARLAMLKEEQVNKAAMFAKELGFEKDQNEIDILRAKNKDKLAEKAQINLDFKMDELEIDRRIGLGESDRAFLHSQNRRERDALLGEAGRGKSDSIGLGPGLAGGAVLIRQLTGNGGVGSAQDPVAADTKSIAKSNELILAAILDTDFSGARAG